MKILAKIFCLFIMFFSNEVSGQITFQRTIGGAGNDHGRAIVDCSNGGYLIVGGSNSFVNPSSDVYIVKIDDEGDFLWGKNIGAENHIEWASDVIETADGDFLIAGYTDNTSGNGYDGMLIKIDPNGNQIWAANFGGSGWDFFEAIDIDEFGNIYLGGITYSEGSRRAWLLKLDDTGSQIWENTIPDLSEGGIYDIHPCLDGSFVFTGNTENPFTGERRVIGGRFDRDGLVYWAEVFEVFGDAEGRACNCTNDQLHIIGNSFELFGPYISDIIVAGFNLLNSEFLWIQFITDEFDDVGMGIGIKQNGNILICGARSVVGDGMRDAYFSEIGPSGEFLGPGFGWTDGGPEDDLLYDIQETPDGGFITTGETQSFGNNSQVYIIKVNAEGESIPENIDFLDLATTVEDQKETPISRIYPNPAQTHIQFYTPFATQFEARLYNLNGAFIRKELMSGNDKLNIEDLQPGIYIIQARVEEDIYQEKLVVLPK